MFIWKTLTLFLTFNFVSIVFGQEEMVCRGEEIKMLTREKEHINECLTKFKLSSIWKIPLEKVACFGVCVLEKKDMLTADGKINHEKAFKYIDDHMTNEDTKQLLIKAADKCIKEHGAQVSDNDPHCHTFLNTGLCVHDAFMEICMDP